MNFVLKTLAEVLHVVVDNRGRTCPTEDDGFPLIATNCIKDDHLFPVFENLRYVSEQTRETWFRGHPEPGDIIFVCKGSPGRVAMTPAPVNFSIAQDMVALRVDESQVDASYLYYVLQSPEVRRDIENMHVGTMIPHFKKGDFKHLRLRLNADVREQERIGCALRALDNKINSNNLLSKTVAKKAHFEFQKILRSADLEILEYGDLNCHGGGTPSTKVAEYWGGEVYWATPTDVTRLQEPYLFGTERKITNEGLSTCASQLFAEGAILMTSRATIGAFAVNQVPTAVNQGFIVVIPNSAEEKWWIFHHMQKDVDMMKKLANGATFLELSRKTFKSMNYQRPNAATLRNFHDMATPLHNLAISAQRENHHLAMLRDALLPHLVDGTLAVRTAEDLVSDVL